ncbi:MAG: 2-oxo-4-hydroxy-4-carboxy-5-ureidoimidazoline decarboxylase, partial [Betaproteobacteria bacterium]|nr:2-oxo-4-hydroxy-4-carboxy-5-ureidoimidazoline decarboxylase [Betaproteobacteria bacterium]MBV9362489.1 2-oxo-4-hydroxy-4-carboxy-5-ureidoimidazoline decarboxylase [Betaproteobacteria bacterium]
MPKARFVGELGTVFEHSAWVAERAFEHRPFASVDELHRAMMEAVHSATANEQLTLLCAHPELAGAEAGAGMLTAHSSGEQGRLGLTSLSPQEFRRISDINRRYRARFGFPCIVALALHADRASVLDEMDGRLSNSREAELRIALEQVS